jgi:negative regulator of sigma E activity
VIAPGGLLPSEYRAEATSRDRAQIAQFDWAGRKVTLADKGARRLVPLPDGAQDPLSMVHQLWFMRPMPAAARLDIATGRKLYEQVYRVVGETAFETPVGLVRAVQLSRRDADGERMDVWLDLDRNLLPARIHFVDRKGMVLEQVIREARIELADAR